MATYRVVTRHVRYWRGILHRWSNVYHYTGSAVTWSNAFLQTMVTQESKMCFGGSGVGGCFQVQVYNQASGGVPLLTLPLFDPTSPGAFPGYAGSVYSPASQTYDPIAESALQVFWAAGLSKSGKGVYLRKWYHAHPVSASSNGSSADVNSASLTALTAAANGFQGLYSAQGLNLSNPSGSTLAGAAQVRSFYGNHQLARGRRRTTASKAAVRTAGANILQRLENEAYQWANE